MARTKALGAFLAVWLTAGSRFGGACRHHQHRGVWQIPWAGCSWRDGHLDHYLGRRVAPDSGYSFAAAADILGVATGVPILLGAFIHFNEVIPVPNLSGVDLNFEFDTNGVPALVSAVFPFAHNETPNNTGTSPADDDIVTITTPLVNIPIMVGTGHLLLQPAGVLDRWRRHVR